MTRNLIRDCMIGGQRLPETVRYAMIGGGAGSFMGPVHRAAAGKIQGLELAAGAFSPSAQSAAECGAELGLPADMVFANYRKLLRKCAALPPAKRISFVSVLTPNALHYPVAMAALDAGMPVLTEKPFACTPDEAANLVWKQRQTGVPLLTAMPYRAYSMLRTAKGMIDAGELGELRRFDFSFRTQWMAQRVENRGNRSALWRTDVHLNGGGGVVTECTAHLQHAFEWLSGLEISEVAADGFPAVPGRILPDECNVLARTASGARGTFSMSRAAIGHREGLAFEISGDKAALRWRQSDPATMRLERADGTSHSLTDATASGVTAHPDAPFGANAAFIDALSAAYAQFAAELSTGRKPSPEERIGLTPEEGLRSVAVSDAVLRSVASSLPPIAAGESSVLSTSREIYARRDDSAAPKWTKVEMPQLRA